MRQAFKDMQDGGFGLRRLEILAGSYNARSLAAHLRVGYQYEGKFRQVGRVHIDAIESLGMPALKNDDARLDSTGRWIMDDLHRLGMTREDWRERGVEQLLDRLMARPVKRLEA